MSERVITLRGLRRDEISDKQYWMVEYRGALISVTTPSRYNRKAAVKVMRYAICKATRLNAADIRHIGNYRYGGVWCSQWYILNPHS
jgi:hypothetical protein